MADKENIEHVNIGDKHIRTDDFNHIVDAVNKFEHASQDPSSVDYSTEDGLVRNNLSRNTIIEDFPFRVEDYNGKNLSIVKGNWTRNFTDVELAASADATQDPDDDTKLLIDIEDFKDAGVNDYPSLSTSETYYVYVTLLADLAETTNNYTAAFLPGTLEVLVDRDPDTVGNRTPAQSNTRATDPFVVADEFVINDQVQVAAVTLGQSAAGEFYIATIEQIIFDDINDYQTMLDGFGQRRNTLEMNYVAGGSGTDMLRFGEYQLNNVDECPGNGSKTLSYFESSSTTNTAIGPSGTLKWAAIDTDYKPQGATLNFKTLEVTTDLNTGNKPIAADPWNANTNSFSTVGLHGAKDTEPSSKSMCYYDASTDDGFNQTQGELKWAVIDTELNNAVQKSIRINNITNPNGGTIDALEIYDFEAPTPISAMAAADTFIIRADDGAGNIEVQYADADAVQDWLNDYGPGPTPGSNDHTDLTDIDAGSYVDHDHGNYFQNADSVAGKYAAASWDYQVNFCSSIGDASANLILDLDNQQLFKSTDAVNPQINWSSAELDDAADWRVLAGCKFFVKDTSTGSTTTGNSAFEVTGGALFGDGVAYKAVLSDTSNTRAAYFVDNTGNTVDICTNTYGIYIAENTKFNIALGNSSQAGLFTDTVAGKTLKIQTGTYGLDSQQAINVSTGTGYDVAGTQVVIDQQPAIADVTETGSDEDQTCRAKVNDILAMLRTHGLIAT